MTSSSNQVFETLAGFRSAAYAVQKSLTILGLLAALGCGIAWSAGWLPGWTTAASGGVFLAGPLWGLLWRKRLENAFWKNARIPKRGEQLQLPAEQD